MGLSDTNGGLSGSCGTLRWGVLGAARTARKRTLPAMLRAGQKVVALAGRSEGHLAGFKEEFGIDLTYHWDQVGSFLQNPTIDAVYIALPSALHAEWTVRSLEAGKHVLCEKPIATCRSEIDKIVSVALQTKRIVQENFSYNLTPGYRYLEKIRPAGVISLLKSVDIRYSFLATWEHRVRYDRMLGGGSFMDLGCYGVDFIHRYLSERIHVLEVDAMPPPPSQLFWGSGPDHPVDVEAKLSGRTESGVRISITTSFVEEARQSVELCMANGDLFVIPRAFRVENDTSEIVHCVSGGRISRENFAVFDTDLEMLMMFEGQVSRSTPMDELQIHRWRSDADVLEEVQALILGKVDRR